MSKEPLKLVSLDVENVLRLKAIHLTLAPDGALVIEAPNEQGKSSVLKSLEILLSGMSKTPDAPLHGDAEKGHIIGVFGDLVVKKAFKAGKRPVLTITTMEGARMQSPQKMLDGLLDHVSLDPLKFMQASDKEKVTILSDIMGFDSSEFDPRIEGFYNARRDARREAKRLEVEADARTYHENAPNTEVSVSDLMAELQKRQAHNEQCKATKDALHNAKVDRNGAADIVKDIEDRLEECKKALTLAQGRLTGHEQSVTNAEQLADTLTPHDESEITAQIATADEINQKVRDNTAHAKAKEAASKAGEAAGDLNQKLNRAEAARDKARLAAREKLPLAELDMSRDAVAYKGKPLSQAGTSAQLRVSVAVAIAANKDSRVKVLLVDDAEKLDADGVKTVLEMAQEADFQVFMTRVIASYGDAGESSVVIEDGEIRGEDKG